MNRFAYRTTGLAIKALAGLSKAKINVHGTDHIPHGSVIFVINHFTRIETLLMPYYIFKLTKTPVWSLADYGLFKGTLGTLLDMVGAVSTKDPDRDLLIVKSLLTGESSWIIFPEGRMVKNKKIVEKGQFMISYAGGKHPPHTGAATLALRTEFYRQRLATMNEKVPEEAKYIMELFQIDSIEPVLEKSTYIVPVNLTYYPIRVRENILSNLAVQLVEDIPERAVEEIMAEGTMLLSGVDVDIRFGKPISIKECVQSKAISRDISKKQRIKFDDKLPSLLRMRKEALRIMQRYMSSIYSLTTVNHDHLFASMLRMTPRKKINPKNLMRRVFLAALFLRDQTEFYLHKSLEGNQTHLLTDDRLNKFSDFLEIALEKNIVKKKGDILLKDRSRFSSPYDFHRARIDNPIEVMANAVEPLIILQRKVRKLARQPGFWIKRKVAGYLIKKAIDEYETDYNEFYIEGESKNKEVGMPRLVKGRSKDTGVVLIHGYMAAPPEVIGLADYLGRKGLWVYVPRVKGHGTSPEDLAVRSYKNWIESVDDGYAIIDSLCKRVVVGGFSNGAGLALELAARVKNIEGVFAVCPPLRLQDFSSKFASAVDVWNKLMNRVHLDDAKMEFVENNPENPHINYLRNPISGVRELVRLMDSVEPKLADIKVPALIAQSQGDPVVDPKGSKRIFELLGSKDKEYILFNFERHGILLGDGSKRVHKAIWDFIRHL
ncbi:MAG: alpha/beta fold hydrolase [Thermodesulfobacteriota bacterium]|nr:alpha/beta fold hydrolase [Thermodesulfobacteriota bacterium]